MSPAAPMCLHPSHPTDDWAEPVTWNFHSRIIIHNLFFSKPAKQIQCYRRGCFATWSFHSSLSLSAFKSPPPSVLMRLRPTGRFRGLGVARWVVPTVWEIVGCLRVQSIDRETDSIPFFWVFCEIHPGFNFRRQIPRLMSTSAPPWNYLSNTWRGKLSSRMNCARFGFGKWHSASKNALVIT